MQRKLRLQSGIGRFVIRLSYNLFLYEGYKRSNAISREEWSHREILHE